MESKLLKHASLHKITAAVIRQCQEESESSKTLSYWQYRAIVRVRKLTGISVDNAIAIVSEMTDI